MTKWLDMFLFSVSKIILKKNSPLSFDTVSEYRIKVWCTDNKDSKVYDEGFFKVFLRRNVPPGITNMFSKYSIKQCLRKLYYFVAVLDLTFTATFIIYIPCLLYPNIWMLYIVCIYETIWGWELYYFPCINTAIPNKYVDCTET